MGLSESVTESRLAGLTALRDRLAARIETCRADRDLAALSQRLMDVLTQIEQAKRDAPPAEGTALDEFTRRRAKRAATSPAGPVRREQRGG